MQIDAQLREAFLEKNNCPFGGKSIILMGDLGQLPPVWDKPLYVGNTVGKVLWKKFNIIVTLDTIFRQQGNTEEQSCFCRFLNNIRNAKPVLDDWEFLMSQADMRLYHREMDLFNVAVHLFPTNNLVSFYNRHFLRRKDPSGALH